MLQSYIWDLDGTLLDSYGSIVTSLVDVARETGAADTYDDIMKAVKLGAVSAYLRELAARRGMEYSELYRQYRKISHERLGEITLMAGAIRTLEGLKRAGASHFVYTHRGASTGPLLERLGLTGFFREIVTFEYGFQPKPSGEGAEYLVRRYGLEKDRTAYIGDRPLDVLCAKNAGIRAVLFRPEDSCVEPSGNEDLVIGHLEELLTLKDMETQSAFTPSRASLYSGAPVDGHPADRTQSHSPPAPSERRLQSRDSQTSAGNPG